MNISGAIFAADETHGRVLRAANRVIAHSQDAGWRSLHAAILEEAPLETTETAVGHPSLIYHLSSPTRVTRQIHGMTPEQSLIGPRGICLTPGDATTSWRHRGRPQILQLYLRRQLYANAVREMYDRELDGADIAPQFAIADPLLEQLALAIAAALREGRIEDGLYVDTLAQMMAVHLARHYASHRAAARLPSAGGAWGRKIDRLLEYIEARLDADLSLDAMAAEVGIGAVHLSRVFKKVTGLSPHQYVMARRIERAKDLLRSSDRSISEVALAAGFCSQSHLGNAFRRHVGVSPGQFRRIA
jgi:AraC family transcriptional regulator